MAKLGWYRPSVIEEPLEFLNNLVGNLEGLFCCKKNKRRSK